MTTSSALVTVRAVGGHGGRGAQGGREGPGFCLTGMSEGNYPLRGTALPGEHSPKEVMAPPAPPTPASPVLLKKGSQAWDRSREEQE